MMTVGTVAFLVPLVVSGVACRFLIGFAPDLGLIDEPTERKAHGRRVPLGGGIAIYLGVVATLGLVIMTAWWGSRPGSSEWLPAAVTKHAGGVLAMAPLLGWILAAATVQMLLGLWDDRFGLSPLFRLGVEVALVLGLVTQGVELAFPPGWHIITIPLTVLWIVGLTNAINFLDNMDGLAGGVVAIASWFFAVIGWLVGDLFVAGSFLMVLGSVLGFLWWNRSPARIFMGDAGSNFLGFWIGVLTVLGTYQMGGHSHVTLLSPLCVLAVPIYDSLTVISLRLWQGQSPFSADRQHVSHRLVNLGFRAPWGVAIVHLVTFVTGISGVILYFVDARSSGLVLAQLVGTLGILAALELGSWGRREEKP